MMQTLTIILALLGVCQLICSTHSVVAGIVADAGIGAIWLSWAFDIWVVCATKSVLCCSILYSLLHVGTIALWNGNVVRS